MGNWCLRLCLRCKSSENSMSVSDHSSLVSSPTTNNRERQTSRNGLYDTHSSAYRPRTFNSLMLGSVKYNQFKIAERALERHVILNDLNYVGKKRLIASMREFNYSANEIILCQGQSNDYFYVVISGCAQVMVGDSVLEEIQEGEILEYMNLNQELNQENTVKAATDCVLWGIDKEKLLKIIEEINQANYELNKRIIESIPLFRDLNSEQIEKILSVIQTVQYPENTVIFYEQEKGNHFYIIKSGIVDCSVNDKHIKEIGEFEYFGEVAFLENSYRMATIKTIKEATLLVIERSELMGVLKGSLENLILSNCQRFSIEQSKYFNFLSAKEIDKIREIAEVQRFKKGETVIPLHSKKSKNLYIVLKGSLKCNKKVVPTLKCIGDSHIVKSNDSLYKKPYVAHEDSVVAVYKRESLEKALKYRLKDLKTHHWLIEMLRNIPLFRLFSRSKLSTIANIVDTCIFASGEKIFEFNEPADSFYIVQKGTVNITKNHTIIRTIAKNNYFGERSILLNEARSATAMAIGPVICWKLSKEKLLTRIDQRTKDQMLKRIPLQNDALRIHELVPIELLGEGSFGKVVLAAHAKSRILYAVKCMDLNFLEEHGLLDRVKLEKAILLKLDHPLIMKLVKRIKDCERVYLINEYVPGKDMYELFQRVRNFNDQSAKFYAICLLIMLDHLHDQNIIYRDLKLENVVVDEDGYPKLVDFGIAKIINGRTYTIVGTPAYMAPEVILGKGYNFSADLWSYGIILYELLYNKMPFGNRHCRIQDMYRSIVQDNLIFPENKNVKQGAKDLIKQLLNKNPYMRGEAHNIKKSPWFAGVKWNEYIIKAVKPPYGSEVKNMKSKIDQNFSNPESLIDFIRRSNSK